MPRDGCILNPHTENGNLSQMFFTLDECISRFGSNAVDTGKHFLILQISVVPMLFRHFPMRRVITDYELHSFALLKIFSYFSELIWKNI